MQSFSAPAFQDHQLVQFSFPVIHPKKPQVSLLTGYLHLPKYANLDGNVEHVAECRADETGLEVEKGVTVI